MGVTSGGNCGSDNCGCDEDEDEDDSNERDIDEPQENQYKKTQLFINEWFAIDEAEESDNDDC